MGEWWVEELGEGLGGQKKLDKSKALWYNYYSTGVVLKKKGQRRSKERLFYFIALFIYC